MYFANDNQRHYESVHAMSILHVRIGEIRAQVIMGINSVHDFATRQVINTTRAQVTNFNKITCVHEARSIMPEQSRLMHELC